MARPTIDSLPINPQYNLTRAKTSTHCSPAGCLLACDRDYRVERHCCSRQHHWPNELDHHYRPTHDDDQSPNAHNDIHDHNHAASRCRACPPRDLRLDAEGPDRGIP